MIKRIDILVRKITTQSIIFFSFDARKTYFENLAKWVNGDAQPKHIFKFTRIKHFRNP